ncbi:hypothetical protein SCLCIDRAFT_23269 [Scleroderma citrinum Foug A]|uniref:Uncharacterized protein n=1 Tax=Scleroderma citrinum Foug A TaxID=1036808 RepID=A0A0C3E967_9AGAM|nr:hypothetical protein SCLCIDRAFT_23269 [Scleroderma citrinum Foug A]
MSDTSALLKRRIAALEEANNQLLANTHSYRLEGRAIRRLVDLAKPISDLIAEHDRRLELGAEDEASADAIEGSTEEEYTYRSFKKLVHWCPSIKKILGLDAGNHDMVLVSQELRKGADGARGDDANALKTAVVNWLNEASSRPEPLLSPTDKSKQGFYNDVTGRLLCPVDYDWCDAFIWSAIREYHPKYPVTAHTYPAFVYLKGQYDPINPSKGIFKGELLVRAFCSIFTSPSSAQAELDNEDVVGSSRKAQKVARGARTRCDVAGLLKMRSVDPCAIAYTTCQLCFALSSSTSWNLHDEEFDYNVLYRNITDYFEQPLSPKKSTEVKELLLWWNRKVFGRRNASFYQPQRVETLSVALARR